MTPSLLLDTCVLLWILDGHPRIVENKEIVSLLRNHPRYFSPISITEIEIKKSIGKLSIGENYLTRIFESGIREWPYRSSDARKLGSLPYHHKDPFDRMIIASAASASAENLIVVTADQIFTRYPIEVRLVP